MVRMTSDEHDALWKLLGKADTPAASPFFARNVLREIRATVQEPPSRIPSWLRGGRFSWLAGVAAVALACIGVGTFEKGAGQKNQPRQEALVAQQLATNPDSDVIKNLDELLASDDNSVWLDNSAN